MARGGFPVLRPPPRRLIAPGVARATQSLKDLPPGNKAPPVPGLRVCLRPRKAVLSGSESVLPRKVNRHPHLLARPGGTETSRLPAGPRTTRPPPWSAERTPKCLVPSPAGRAQSEEGPGGAGGCEGAIGGLALFPHQPPPRAVCAGSGWRPRLLGRRSGKAAAGWRPEPRAHRGTPVPGGARASRCWGFMRFSNWRGLH